MSNYVQTTFFTPKDGLPPSDPAKTIFGAAYDVEFGNISSAIASKYDPSSISAGPIAFALGSAAAPSVTFLGELGTGLYSNVSGDLGYATAGVACLTISGSSGGVIVGTAFGGSQGAGTLNAVNLYVNGTAVSVAGATVTFIAGTANEIAASASTGAITLSLPQNVIIPTPASGAALTVNAVSSNYAGIFNASATGSPFRVLYVQGATSGTSHGIFVQAGLVSTDSVCLMRSASGSQNFFELYGDGHLTIGGPTGISIACSAAGNASIAAPSSGVAFSVTGVAGTHSTTITDSATNSFNAGFLEIPQVSQSAAYTTVRSDSGKHIYHPSADTTARTWTIASNASVPYPIGTAITFDNDTGAGVITLAITTDTLVWLPAGSTGSRSIAAGGQATALKVTSTRWHLTGVGIT